MTEIWKDIKGFEGLYQVSNLGRVKSLEKEVHRFMPHWETKSDYVAPERIRKLGTTRGGYTFIPLTKDGKRYGKRVNRLVAEAFLDGFDETVDVHHKDGDRTNNKADNLECVPTKEHREIHKKTKKVVGIKGDTIIRFESVGEVRSKGFDPANVSRCCKAATLPEGHPRRKKYATHKGFVWRYAE